MNLQEMKASIDDSKQLELKDRVGSIEEVAKHQEANHSFKRTPTQIDLIDNCARLKKDEQGGLAEGDIVIIAAPTGNGKSLLAATLSHSFATQLIPVLWFSYEIGTYNLWQVFNEMEDTLPSMSYIPFEHTTGKLDWVEAKIKEGIEKYNTKLVVIDHLGFLAPFQTSGNMNQNYAAYMTQIVRELKTIAIREKITIILPAHMNKAATDDPTLADIAHSGGIAQEADLVILLAREENHSNSDGNYFTPYTRIKIAKNRIGSDTPSGWLIKNKGKLEETLKETVSTYI